MVLGLAEAARRQLGLAPKETPLLLGLGSYGRRELCPKSDVDLLLLLPEGATADAPAIRGFVDALLYGLWDVGFEVGPAVRTVEECLALAAADATVSSALFDRRVLEESARLDPAGRDALARLDQGLGQLLSGPGADLFVAAKLGEAEARRSKFGTTVFLLEPNVKESEGGLRDWHLARWIARARFGVMELPDLLRLGALEPTEANLVARAYDFLLAVRVELHHLAGRRQDVLGFPQQERVAERLGYLNPGLLDVDRRTHGVERLMRAYYFHARNLRVGAKLVIERAQAEGRRRPAAAYQLGRFRVWKDSLTTMELDQLRRDPVDLVRIFRVAQEEALPIDSYTKAQIREQAERIDRRWRRDPALVEEFLRLLEDPRADGAIFGELHDLGVLRRIIPEVSRITARWQRSQYHSYTVDAHSLFVLQTLKALRRGDFAAEEAELTRACEQVTRPAVLYLAGFLHDVGKGWPRGDHSRRGAQVAQVVGARLEAAGLLRWTPADTEDVAWLVAEHLTFSDVAQRRDLGDPSLHRSLADAARTTERLTMWWLLTYADMRSTSPKVWTSWKRALLHELYLRTRQVLEDGPQVERPFLQRRAQAEAELLALLRARGEDADGAEVRAFLLAMPDRYLLSVPARQMARHLGMWRRLGDGPEVHVRPLVREDVTRLTISGPDRPGLLAAVTGVLAGQQLQVLRAEIYSMAQAGPNERPGVLDVLWIKDEGGHAPTDPDRWRRVEAELRAAWVDGAGPKRAEPRRGLPERPRPPVKVEVHFSNQISPTHTVIDVYGPDRLGVLSDLTRTLAEAGLTIHLAKISTQGDRIADGFYVADAVTGAKLEEGPRRSALEQTLRGVLTPAPPSG